MKKAYTRAGVVTGGFLFSQSQGTKTPAWNLFYKRKRAAYNAKLIKKRFNFIVIFYVDHEFFFTSDYRTVSFKSPIKKRVDYEYDFTHNRSS